MTDETKAIRVYDPSLILIHRPNHLKIKYYQDEIIRLEGELRDRHTQFTQMNEKMDRHRIKLLESFRHFFMLDCIVLNRKLDLLQCRNTIAEGRCIFHEKCIPRKDLIERLHLDNGELSGVQPPASSSPLY